MAARSSKTRRADWLRFVRHVEQKHGRAAASAAMTAEQLAGVLDREGMPGIWAGKLANRLGLRGRTTTETIRDVFLRARVVQEAGDGEADIVWNLRNKFDSTAQRADRLAEAVKEAETGESAADEAATEPGREGGFHGMVFGLPKSVSALALIGDPEVLAALEAAAEAYRDAVMATFDSLARCRSGRRGVTSEPAEGVIGATWIHRGSGTGDPHWHVHVALHNSTWREGDEEGRALDGRVLLATKRLAEAAGLAAMEATLSAKLGLGPGAWIRVPVGSVVVPELSAFEDITGRLSTARADLSEREVAGRTYNADALRWRQQRAAAFASAKRARAANTRKRARDEAVGSEAEAAETTPEEIEAYVDLACAAGDEAWAELQALWRNQAGDQWQAAEMVFTRHRTRYRGAPPKYPTDDKRLAEAMNALLNRNATPSFFDFAAIARSYGLDEKEALVRGAMHFDLLVEQKILKSRVAALPVALALVKGETIDTAALHAAAGVGRPASISWAAWRADRALQRRAEALAEARGRSFQVEVPEGIDDDQLEVIQLAASGRKLCVIAGVAGAGKTVGMGPVSTAAKLAGLTVVATARNANRASETGEGIEADQAMSLAMLLLNPDLGKDRPVLVVLDEAGVVDRQDMEALLALAEDPARRIQIVAMGDRRQAQAIDGFAAFASLEKGAQRAGAVSRLNTSYRCKAWLKEAEELRAGEGARVLDRVLSDGRLVETRTEAAAAEAMADAVLTNEGSVALASTNEEAARISRLVQKMLGREGIVPLRFGSRAAVGDRIRARRNDHRNDILNGDEFTVVAIRNDYLVVRGKRGLVNLPLEYCREWVELGYAATIDGAQGVTAERAIVRVDPAMGNSKIYSAATRGKKAPIFVTVGENGAEILSAAIHRDDVQKTADEIVEEMESAANEAPQESETRRQAEEEKRKALGLLKAQVEFLRSARALDAATLGAIRKLGGYYLFRWGERVKESEAQDVVIEQRQAAVRELHDLERAVHVAEFLARAAEKRATELAMRRRPTSLFGRRQAAADAAAAREEAKRLREMADSKADEFRRREPELKDIVRACESAANGLRWSLRNTLRKASDEMEEAADILAEAIYRARGQTPPARKPAAAIQPRSSAEVRAEIGKVSAEAEASGARMAEGLEAMARTMEASDPARLAGQAHAEATRTSFELRLQALERELQATLRAERTAAAAAQRRAHSASAGPGTPSI
ncbi:AAA family ATPase (plasmid) [Acidiphilium multivorum]|uniref:AAA family ATPase n=1 Tax=Acidiphilium multivorum TaxID=62140 RepID=UPI001CDB74DA|nr:AAA family ATPase [Acidiphilium multivorum]UBU64070.1 relaxase domain-containing protein [Acidithiobacillus ferrooxidans]UNC16649.1 AAA family ATPase [Acidiphilium multivorum]